MDNVTHTLIGLAAGEAVAVYRKKARAPLWIASALANNLPDLDVALTSFVFRDKLGYLLHHRGHTHTLLLAPLQSLFLMLLLWVFWRKREAPWKELGFLSFLGVFLHLFADFWNSYGVHPFWPWRNDWIYGDMVFIVEPWAWVLFLPPLAISAARKLTKAAFYALLFLILALAWKLPLVPWPMATLLSAGALSTWLFARSKRVKESARIYVPLVVFCLALLGMKGISWSLKAKHGSVGAETLVQPFPANPFCWTFMESRLDGPHYSAEIRTLAAFPSLVGVENCPELQQDTTAPLENGIFRSPRDELEELSRQCGSAAFLRFARIPYWKKENGDWILGDLRFDRGSELGFAEFKLSEIACPSVEPPWTGPFHPTRIVSDN